MEKLQKPACGGLYFILKEDAGSIPCWFNRFEMTKIIEPCRQSMSRGGEISQYMICKTGRDRQNAGPSLCFQITVGCCVT